MKAMLIINPISGVSGKEGLAEYVAENLRDMGSEVDVRHTRCGGDATRLAQMAVEQGADAVIVAGGDGTVNETATALCGSRVTMGIIPCGSGNGLARHLGIPVDVDGALKVIEEGKSLRCDYATVGDHPFFCTFGVGFDAEVSFRFAKGKKRGKLSYLKSALAEYARYRPQLYRITADGVTLERRAMVVAVCNASQYGNNAYIAPRATMTDGMLDVTVVHTTTPLETMIAGADMMAGLIGKNSSIDTIRGKRVVIQREFPGPAHIDGEPLVMGTRIEIECHPGALSIYSPEGHDRDHFYPIITPLAEAMLELGITLRHLLPGSNHYHYDYTRHQESDRK